MRKYLLFTMLLSITMHVFSQEIFEPQFFKTGYIATELEYINGFEEMLTRNSIGLSEAGLLLTYLPNAKTEFKSVFVYKPGQSLDMSLVEANVTYKFKPIFNIKLGRFLAPLSPFNMYFYAPMNIGITTPMAVSQREFYPQSIEGLNIYSDFTLTHNFSINYNFMFGGYFDAKYAPTGTLRFHGREPILFAAGDDVNEIQFMGSNDYNYQPTMGAKLSFDFQEYFHFGLNSIMTRTSYDHKIGKLESSKEEIAMNFSHGADLTANIGNLKLTGEYWTGRINALYAELPTKHTKSYFFEISYRLGSFTPFIAYDYILGSLGVEISRPKFGISYRPSFSSIIKLEQLGYVTNATEDFRTYAVSYVYSF